MEKTDRQTGKSSRWQFTAYEKQWPLFENMPPGIAEWGWQKEICPNTQKPHYQGFVRTQVQVRASALNKIIPGVHIEVSRNWEALKNYCRKQETRAPDSRPIHQVSQFMTIYQYTDDVAKRFAFTLDSKESLKLLPKVKLIQYIDALVRQDIQAGKRYAAHIATNPQWITLWNKYAYELIFSFMNIDGAQELSVQEDAPASPQGP